MKREVKHIGADYRVRRHTFERTSSRTWELLSRFPESYKPNSAEQQMQLIATGPKRELWPLFQSYARLTYS